jgi:hypothetical protein
MAMAAGLFFTACRLCEMVLSAYVSSGDSTVCLPFGQPLLAANALFKESEYFNTTGDF